MCVMHIAYAVELNDHLPIHQGVLRAVTALDSISHCHISLAGHSVKRYLKTLVLNTIDWSNTENISFEELPPQRSCIHIRFSTCFFL
jgi:hypothetical protein